jgi:hypothetical protein
MAITNENRQHVNTAFPGLSGDSPTILAFLDDGMTSLRQWFEDIFYKYMYGDWESVSHGLWVYGHMSILVATALVGYTFARQRYLLTLLLLPFPLVYVYKRHEKAQRYKVQSDTPIEPGEDYDPEEHS